MSWLFQVMLNYLFIILPVYAAGLGLKPTVVGQMFAVNIGVRFFPNMLVTKIGTASELPMWTLTLAGFVVSYLRPTQPWALYFVAGGAGCGFTRACVSLHTQHACKGSVDDLTIASKRCGAARSLGDISGFVLPPLAYKFGGWQGFTLFGGALTVLYLIMSLYQLKKRSDEDCERSTGSSDTQLMADAAARDSEKQSLKSVQEDTQPAAPPIAWIDWAISAAFISTELQMNLFITAVPQALLRHFEVPPTYVGVVVGAGAFATLLYIMALPFLPLLFNQHRPVNLILTYSGMFAGWVLMVGALTQTYVPAFLCAAYFYQSMVGASQVVMLECLTGICDSTNSAKILGVAEMVGCFFGMLGGYAGEALLMFGIRAPFAMGLLWTFFSVSFLTISFVLRQSERDGIPSQWSLEAEKPQEAERRILICAVSGVNNMVFERANSFISSEKKYREVEMGTQYLQVETKSCDVA
jgi:hypothetical protein